MSRHHSIEEIERARWSGGPVPPSSEHLPSGDFDRLREEEKFVRAVEAEADEKMCVVCGGPVFHGSSLGAPMTIFSPSPAPEHAHINVSIRPIVADFHIHGDCARDTPSIVVRQKVEALRLREGRVR
jgi:hypothetical protein